jgi:3-hydroxyacyl-[acyl-carrier-protein] dehydratase
VILVASNGVASDGVASGGVTSGGVTTVGVVADNVAQGAIVASDAQLIPRRPRVHSARLVPGQRPGAEMPNTPILDFETVDLSRVVVEAREIYALLRHGGRFRMLDGILHFDPAGKFIVGFKDIRADDWWATDHIPGRPIFPGALMIEAAAQVCSYDYMKRAGLGPETFLGFGGLDAIRFRGLVEPGARMLFAGEMKRIRSKMFSYHAQGYVEREIVFEADVLGVVV